MLPVRIRTGRDEERIMAKDIIKKGLLSFAISAFAGLFVNLLIDLIVNGCVTDGFCSISPDFRALFPTDTIACYVNLLLYGLIGATFAMMTFIYSIERIGFVIQSILYFVVTGGVCLLITMILWQLQRYPQALIVTLAGYAATHIIMILIEYRTLKRDIREINSELE